MRRKSTLFVLTLLGYCLTHCTSGLLLKEQESLPAKLAQVTIRIRRDTSAGIPIESVHSLGLSQIVGGEAPPGTLLTISLQRGHALLSVRQIVVPRNGLFAISLDRFRETCFSRLSSSMAQQGCCDRVSGCRFHCEVTSHLRPADVHARKSASRQYHHKPDGRWL